MRIALALLLCFATHAAAQEETEETQAPVADTAAGDDASAEARFTEKVSYCVGLDLGRRLSGDDVPVDLGAVVAGLRDGLSGESQLTDEQIDAVMRRFNQVLQQKAAEKMANAAEENLARGEAFLAENLKKDGVQSTESGLQYRVIEEGDGPSPGPRDTVRCHYEGTLIDGSVFDSSYKRGQPAVFPVGGVIEGWVEALQMMKVGAKWEVFLPAKIAYKERGSASVIGPNETLVFQIELLEIVE